VTIIPTMSLTRFVASPRGTILDVTENETVQALRQAERDGLVHEETDESRNVAPDFNRQVWFLTDAGREKRDRLKLIP
jgi:DNA-binding PadR family transcriptional regulator